MKAVILKDKVKMGDPIAPIYYEDVEIPQPGAGEVLIRLRNAAINRRDIFVRYGAYPGIDVPAIIGSDGAGTIEAVGEGITGFEIGDEVVINPAMDWGDDTAHQGPNYSSLGVPIDGTHAEYIKITAKNVFPKPKHLTWEEAAALPLAGLTTYRAVVTKGKVKEGDTVIIPGIGGGAANFALQIAVAKGAKVYVTSSSDEKIANAISRGAAGGVNYRNDQWAKELKALSGGADVSIDTIGGKTFTDLVYLAKPASKIVSFGATTGPIPNLVMPRIFFKQMQVLGTMMGSPMEFAEMLNFYEEHELRPVIDRVYALEEIEAAHEQMEHGEVLGKIVLSIP